MVASACLAFLSPAAEAALVGRRPEGADRNQDSAEGVLAVLRAALVVVLAGHRAVLAAVTVKADSAQ